LSVSFEKINLYEIQQQQKEYKEIDNQETRIAGWGTMIFGALLGGAVALGGNDDDGNHIDPNPELGKGIIIGGLILGGVLAIIPDSKAEISSSTTSQKHETYEPIQQQDSLYTIWSNIYPEKVISKTLVNERINLDVVADLGLDYVEKEDSIKVYFQSNWDETLLYTVGFPANRYLKRYLNTNTVSDSITLHQAPTTNSPVVGYLTKGDNLEFVEKVKMWNKAMWNERVVYLKAEDVEYFYANQ